MGCSKAAPPPPLQLARTLHHQAEWAAAIEQCDLHLAANPDDGEALLIRGRSRFAMGQLNEALADLNRVVELDESKTEPLYIRSMIHKKMGELELAAADRDRAITRDPNYESAYEYSPSNFARPIEIELGMDRPESDSDRVADSADKNKRQSGQDQPYSVEEPYATEEPYAVDEPYTAQETNTKVAEQTGEANAEPVAAADAPKTSKPFLGLPGATPPVSSPLVSSFPETGENETELPQPEENAPFVAPRPQVSSALPTVPQISLPQPGYANSQLPSQLPSLPRSTGIQSAPGATSASAPNPLLGIPLPAPISTYPPAGNVTGVPSASQPGLVRTPTAGVPTGGTSLPPQVSTSLPTQLAPQSPYALHANPLPGQTRQNLSTSIRPQATGRAPTTGPAASTRPAQPLSTALPPQ